MSVVHIQRLFRGFRSRLKNKGLVEAAQRALNAKAIRVTFSVTLSLTVLSFYVYSEVSDHVILINANVPNCTPNPKPNSI